MGTQLESTGLEEYAVLWGYSGKDARGRPTVSSPVEISVRWEQGLKLDLGPEAGNLKVDATVFVNQEIEINSIMWFGQEDNLPSTLVDLNQVIDYKRIPDIKGRYTRKAVLLKKYHDTLPTIS